ncbi:hypothetical protein AAC387_Pa02g3375 [Persea americana]
MVPFHGRTSRTASLVLQSGKYACVRAEKRAEKRNKCDCSFGERRDEANVRPAPTLPKCRMTKLPPIALAPYARLRYMEHITVCCH